MEVIPDARVREMWMEAEVGGRWSGRAESCHDESAQAAGLDFHRWPKLLQGYLIAFHRFRSSGLAMRGWLWGRSSVQPASRFEHCQLAAGSSLGTHTHTSRREDRVSAGLYRVVPVVWACRTAAGSQHEAKVAFGVGHHGPPSQQLPELPIPQRQPRVSPTLRSPGMEAQLPNGRF